MIPEDSKILTEFVGKCWHEYPKGLTCASEIFSSKCFSCGVQYGQFDEDADFDDMISSMRFNTNQDLTTPDGFQLLADEIGKRGGWAKLYVYVWCGGNGIRFMSPAEFHEKQPADKQPIVLEAIKAGVFGEVKS